MDFSKNINKFIKNYSKTNSYIKFEIIIDESKDVLKAFDDTINSLIETIILVSVIVYLLIGSLCYSFAIPVSLSGSFIALYLFGYTINNATKLAMVLAIGLVVDYSIIIVENAEHYYNKNNIKIIMHLRV
ncbi:MAG: efflux RND transporter permease subunit [Francisella endosymbiont of Hyalomma scupense]